MASTPGEETMIEVSNLTKRYGEQTAVSNRLRRQTRRGNRIPGSERSRQIDNNAHDSGT